MATEIERKFLVAGEAWKSASPIYICQGYLSTDKHRTVRVRIAGDHAQLTVKGVSRGAVRAEFEYEIPIGDAREMLKLCDRPLIEKYRHHIASDGLVWEVDEFLGDNTGLVVAEVELKSEDQEISLPAWVGDEVTHDRRFFNSSLTKHPFKAWN